MSTTTFLIPNDLSDLCRVCLQLPEESQYLDLTTIYDEEDNLTYGECFTICTQIDLSVGEGVPHYLCKSCGLELQMSYDFHKKIEESKRVIEQCQRQIKEQNEIEKGNIVQLMNEKYVIDDDDGEERQDTSEQMVEAMPTMPHENEQVFDARTEVDEEVAEVDMINKICHTEDNTQHEVPPDKDNETRPESMNENNVGGDLEEELEIDDYQNLEALEDEETETLQIEKRIPIQIIKYDTECGESEEYVEYAEEEDELNKKNARISSNKDTDQRLRWQDNVVAVASKEHLPVKDDEDEEEITYETSDGQIVLDESSQDENVGVEEEVEEATAKNANKNTNKNNNNNPTRKRHVGSYSCDYCKRVYPNYSRMKTHRRCHEADRPKFSCSACGRMYATKQARDCHVQTAHEKSGYTCNICNKVFAIRKSLEIHIRYHTGDFPYECNSCDKKFAQACHLNTHINVKHNKIRFSCDYPGCGKFFTSSTSLRNHEYTHGIMPFECEYCQQGYPAKAKLRVHIQRKHGLDLNKDQLEKMRKFHVMRSKVNLVQFVDT